MSRSRSLGLGLLGLLSVLDATAPLFAGGGDSNPPMSVALVGSVLGLASVACIFYVVRGADRAVLALVVLRVLSALSAVPAFFVDDVAPGFRVLAAAVIGLTAIGTWLLLAPSGAAQVREVQVR